MSLDSLERSGCIKELPISKSKVEDALNLARRDITTAKSILDENSDWSFSIAYNAMLQSIRALMFSKGYRPSGSNQHITVVRFAELFLDEETVIIFDRMRRKRHSTIYDTSGTISKREAENAVDTAEKLVQNIENMIQNQ
jgi:uncharacterized protein (UPF0332 family)